jgi:hypothetical protein
MRRDKTGSNGSGLCSRFIASTHIVRCIFLNDLQVCHEFTVEEESGRFSKEGIKTSKGQRGSELSGLFENVLLMII